MRFPREFVSILRWFPFFSPRSHGPLLLGPAGVQARGYVGATLPVDEEGYYCTGGLWPNGDFGGRGKTKTLGKWLMMLLETRDMYNPFISNLIRVVLYLQSTISVSRNIFYRT